MKNYIEMVAEFHYLFDQKDAKKPTVGSVKQGELRYTLQAEENSEYLEAVRANDLVGIADALGDQLYILYGTVLKHGLQDKIEDVFKEIQRSNLSKLGADGKPIYREDGKILKGPDYFKPNIKKILDQP
jgi:predicted HAD superfamily Cof-like phosphohydrolase